MKARHRPKGRTLSEARAEIELIFAEALASPIGLLLWSDDPEAFAQVLYRARAAKADPECNRLQIRMVDLPDGNIALVKGEGRERGKPKDTPPPSPSAEDLDL